MRLTARLALALFVVAAIAVGAASILINRAAVGEFDRYATRVRAASTETYLENLGRDYLRQGQWTLPSSGPFGRLVIVDENGTVVAGAGQGMPGRLGAPPPGWTARPIVVEGQRLGTAYMAQGMDMGGMAPGFMMPHDAFEGDFRNQANRALTIGLAAALGAALALAMAAARYLARPIRSLRSATAAIAGGNLAHRTGIRRGDEIGDLAADFDRMAEALESQETSRRQLFADLAHELRTPLTILRGNLQAVADGVYEAEPERMRGLISRVDGVARLIDDIRDLSLADVNRLELQLAEVDLSQLIQAAADRFSAAAASRGVSLQIEDLDQAAPVTADPDRLDQALDNLIQNALEHTPEGGSIYLGLAAEVKIDRAVIAAISVRDTGPGIPEADLEKVFERFYRSDASRSRATGGTGLGLAIVRAIARAHRGDATARNQPGGGAIFTITLPVRRTPTPTSGRASGPDRPAGM